MSSPVVSTTFCNKNDTSILSSDLVSEVFADNPLQDINLYNERYFGTVVSST